MQPSLSRQSKKVAGVVRDEDSILIHTKLGHRSIAGAKHPAIATACGVISSPMALRYKRRREILVDEEPH
jgi:hypothetical protein